MEFSNFVLVNQTEMIERKQAYLFDLYRIKALAMPLPMMMISSRKQVCFHKYIIQARMVNKTLAATRIQVARILANSVS